MAVERNPYRMPVNELVNLLVVWEVMGQKKAMDEAHIRHMPGTVHIPAIDCPCLDDPIGILQREWQRGTVEINHHAGDGSIDICRYPVLVSEENAGFGIAVVPEFLTGKKQQRADSIRDFCPTMGNGYQERVTLYHRYQYMDIASWILLTFGYGNG